MPYFLSSFILKDVFLVQKVRNRMTKTRYLLLQEVIPETRSLYATTQSERCLFHKGLVPQTGINETLKQQSSSLHK